MVPRFNLRIENEKYLREHPEIKDIAKYFCTRVLLEDPEDVFKFAQQVLGDRDLKQKIQESK